jgi:hypothetical protein
MPSISSVITTDITLTRTAQMRKRQTYIADRIAPPYPVDQKTEKIMTIDPKARLTRKQADVRAPGTPAKIIDVNVSRPVTFDCTHKALANVVPDEIMASPIQALQSLQLYAGNIAESIKLARESRLKDLIVANLTGGLTTAVAAADRFDAATAAPVSRAAWRHREMVAALVQGGVDLRAPRLARANAHAPLLEADVAVAGTLFETEAFLLQPGLHLPERHPGGGGGRSSIKL